MNTITTQWPDAISERKRDFIIQLIFQHIEGSDERERYLSELESISNENDADDIVKSLSNINEL